MSRLKMLCSIIKIGIIIIVVGFLVAKVRKKVNSLLIIDKYLVILQLNIYRIG